MEGNNEEDKESQDKDQAEETFSLDDLDQLLEEEDPEFSETMSKIETDKDIKDAKIEDFEEVAQESSDKVEDTVRFSLKERVIKKIKDAFNAMTDFIYFGSLKVKKVTLSLVQKLTLAKNNVAIFFKTGFPERINFFKVIIKRKFSAFVSFFKKLSLIKKIVFLLIPVAIVAVVLLSLLAITGNLLPQLYRPYLASLSNVAQKTYSFNPEVDMREFQKVFPQREYTVQLSEVKVNLLPDPDSSPLPMAYIELYIGTNTPQSTIEIKSREKEFMDVVQRTMEKFTHKELNGVRGKERFKEVVAQKVNEELNVGSVTAVYFKMIILKK